MPFYSFFAYSIPLMRDSCSVDTPLECLPALPIELWLQRRQLWNPILYLLNENNLLHDFFLAIYHLQDALSGFTPNVYIYTDHYVKKEAGL